MLSRRWAIVWAAASSSVVFVIGLQLPLWERTKLVWVADDYSRVKKESVPVWQGLMEHREPFPAEQSLSESNNRTTCFALLIVAGIVGSVVYWVRRPRTRPLEADDYSDGPGGSIPDGREWRTTGGTTTSPRTGSP